jgi:hypothetical protein
VIASSVIDAHMATAKTRPLAVAYHYCDYADKRTLEPNVIFGSLARVLLENMEMPTDIMQAISELYHDGGRIPETKEVLGLLSKISDLFKDVVLVIDGVGEVKEEDRLIIYESLKTLIASQKMIIKLYMSCRENVLAVVSTVAALNFRVHFSEKIISTDIQSYIHYSVASLIEKGEIIIRKPELETAIADALVEGAKGM